MPRSEPAPSTLELARTAFDRRAWSEAYARLTEADRSDPLALEDLERLALTTYLLGREAESLGVQKRTYRESTRLGDVGRAARSAFWLTMNLALNGDLAQAGGWLARGNRVVEESGSDLVERGYLLVPVGIQQLEEGDHASALDTFGEVDRAADRFSDPDLGTLARLGQGDALIGLGETRRGVALLDEAMVAVTSGEVSPIVVGIIYCSVIETCRGLFDLRRAQEWTVAFTRWCDAQHDLVPYRGQCLLYRAELKQFHGAWQEAIDEARLAEERLDQPADEPIAGGAYYRQAELHRLRGEFATAESAYRRAGMLGQRPEPGLALLRLAQGRPDVAAASITRALDEEQRRAARPRLLDPYVEIMLATAAVEQARAAADELAAIAADSDAPLLAAMSTRADGAVRLAEGDARGALAALRQAWSAWQALDAPYDAARVRVLIAAACRELGDHDAASMELEAAGEAFRRLGATPDLARIQFVSGSGLTERELEVLRLVAVGKTNRAIGEELVISEKTVARHVANIFTKLDLSSRSAATAYAYEHDLVSRPA